MSQDNKVKYLQMIQDVVKRMADTSAAMKRYTLVAFAGAAALARALEEPGAMLLAMVLVFIFWALDAQYLRQEKWFRDMYDLAQAVSETAAGIAAALEDMDSRLSDINNRLDQLSVAD